MKITHINGKSVIDSFRSSFGDENSMWYMVADCNVPWMTKGGMISPCIEDPDSWVPISSVTGTQKDLFS